MFVLEIIGILLGVAPLLIEAGKLSHDMAGNIRLAFDTRKHKDWLAEFFRDLSYELTMFRLTLHGLVKDLDLSDHLKHQLLKDDNLNPDLWTRPSQELVNEVSSRLGSSMEAFVMSLECILTELGKFVNDKERGRSLPIPLVSEDVRDPREVSRQRLLSILAEKTTFHDRFKFGITKEKRRQRIERIAKHNKRLSTMLQRSVEHTSIPFDTKRHEEANSYTPDLSLRDKISGLPNAMASLLGSCARSGHEIFVELFRPWHDSKISILNMIMNLSCTSTSRPRYWSENRVQLGPETNRTDNSTNGHINGGIRPRTDLRVRVDSATMSISGETMTNSPEEYTMSPSNILPHQDSARSAASTVVNGGVDEPQPVRGPAQQDAPSLCTMLKNNTKRRICSEFVLTDERLLPAEPKARHSVDISHREFSLEELLTTKDARFTLRHRKFLQVIIARSLVFYLWDEGHNLDKSSLYFLGKRDIDIYRLFTPLHPQQICEDDAANNNDEEFEYNVSPNATLAAFAIILLELELNTSIESLRSAEDLDDDGKITINTSFFTATRWLKENPQELYPLIYKVLNACLNLEGFNVDDPSLKDPDFLEQVYQIVVAPLESHVNTGFPHELKALEAKLVEHAFQYRRQSPMRPTEQRPNEGRNVTLAIDLEGTDDVVNARHRINVVQPTTPELLVPNTSAGCAGPAPSRLAIARPGVGVLRQREVQQSATNREQMIQDHCALRGMTA